MEFGYFRVEGEKEFVTLRCRTHHSNTCTSELEEAAARVWEDQSCLFRRILSDISRGLDWHTNVWDDILDGTTSLPEKENEMSTGTLLRLFRYEAGKGFAGVHTDLGLLTVCIGDQRGLQVLDRELVEGTGEEKWIDVKPGTMVVLVGQTLKALTGGRVRPGIHRVVVGEGKRYSVVFALRHSWKHDVDLGRFGGEGRVEAKRLWEALQIGVVNINADKNLRDRQRLELDRMRQRMEESGQG